jgi:thiamine biosynthesis lipoprotein
LTDYTIEQRSDYYSRRFFAMASPCELLIETTDQNLASMLTKQAQIETKRIEQKYSRYLENNLMYKINHSNGHAVDIDSETFRLIEFANTCYQLSDGLFDVTSGVLRKIWKFDGSDNIPNDFEVNPLLPFIGWKKVNFSQTQITLPTGFELDFGGIGKEYAVDAVATICKKLAPQNSVLINFGGDIQVTRPRVNCDFWQVGIERPGIQGPTNAVVNIASGGLATSGDARRFLLKDNIRYGHILNPLTGYPIVDAPRSITVAAEHCIQSGLLATLALLQGPDAEQFLKQQGVTYWCFW